MNSLRAHDGSGRRLSESATGYDGPATTTEQERPDTGTAGPLVDPDSTIRPDVTLVIPTKNEAEGIVTCIERAVSAFEQLGMTAEIIVSDNSSDGTPEFAREHGARVVTPDRIGYGYAYQYAFEHARGDLVAMGDGDTTYDFRELPALIERLESSSADIVMGSRLDGDIRPGAMPPLHRLVGNPMLTGFLNTFYDAGVSDAHSGMRVFYRDVLETLDLTADGMEFASEMIMEAGAAGLTIEEVPITYHPREGEATIHTFRDGWRHVRFMLVNAPGYLFSVPATTILLGGLGILLTALLAPSAVPVPEYHLAVAGSLLLFAGYTVGVLGLTAPGVGEPIRRPRDPISRSVDRWFTLERGLFVGVALLGGSLAAALVGPELTAAATVTVMLGGVLGLQTVFYAFFLSLLLPTSRTDRQLYGPTVAPVECDGGSERLTQAIDADDTEAD